jgi:FixJ family two-component response regulator
LITDILLRGGGGGVELSALAATFRVPTLLMSGHPDYIKAQPGKATAFLAKPFRAATLETAVRQLLYLAVHDAAADEQPRLAAGQ